MTDAEWGKQFRSKLASFAEWKKFNRLWDKMARLGKCDARGGAEYRRVIMEWTRAGKPTAIACFIARRANIGPEDTSST